MIQKPILIVGAGPTGLFSAFLLKKRGIPVRVIDRKKGPTRDSKALAIHPRTLEIFDKVGLSAPFLENGIKLDQLQIHKGNRCCSLPFSPLDTPYPFILSLPQSATEKILIEELKSLGIDVEWEQEYNGSDGNEALVLSFKTQQSYRIPFHSLLGCDGARSRVREFYHFAFEGKDLKEEILLIDLKAKSPLYPNGFHILPTKSGPIVIIPIKAEHYRVIIPHFSDFKFSHHPPTVEDFNLFLKNRGLQSKLVTQEVIWSSIFSLRQKMVSHLRKENVFLIGDAAHIHSPVGGQGMNTSLQDAFNLAWKLELVYKNLAYESILDSYEHERLPVIHNLLSMTKQASQTLIKKKYITRFLLYFFCKLLNFRLLREKLLGALTQISIKYKKSACIRAQSRDQKWEGPKAGMRAPDAELSQKRRLFDLLRTSKHTLLVFDPDSIFLNDEFMNEYAGLLEVHYVSGEDLMNKYAAQSDSIYLIRPDGMIGYRSQNMRVEEVISYIFRIFKPASLKSTM